MNNMKSKIFTFGKLRIELVYNIRSLLGFTIMNSCVENAAINFHLFPFGIWFVLPFKLLKKHWSGEAISFDINTEYIYIKWFGKYKFFYYPWKLEFYKSSLWVETGNTKGYVDLPDFVSHHDWPHIAHKVKIPFTYTLKNGTVQERVAEVRKERMEWRRPCFFGLPCFNKVVENIWCEFNDEVGERSGSWKGGTVGCGYHLKPNETIEDCFQRMLKERTL